MSPRVSKIGLLAAATLACAGTAYGTAAVAGLAQPDPVGQAGALTRVSPVEGVDGPRVAAKDARAVAASLTAQIPLPAGGTFSGIRWETLGGTVSTGEIESMLEYNAACQWLRARRDGRDAKAAATVLKALPAWPALRGTESARVLSEAVGGGELRAGVLADCDASHDREVAYANAIGLAPSS
jgi:hypothetical protein